MAAKKLHLSLINQKFQHTATRRWLLNHLQRTQPPFDSFNTQPPEGGCFDNVGNVTFSTEFQHTATRRWLQKSLKMQLMIIWFQHTATRRWLQTAYNGKYSASMFQHTATRRWLLLSLLLIVKQQQVSTHSHPKVAAPYIKKQEKSAN